MKTICFLIILTFFSLVQHDLAQSDLRTCDCEIRHAVFPVYPVAAIATGISGDVVIKVKIDNDGNVAGVKMLTGQKLLATVVEKAMAGWKFSKSDDERSQIITFTFAIVPDGIAPELGSMVILQSPDKIKIFGLGLKDSVGVPLLSNKPVNE